MTATFLLNQIDRVRSTPLASPPRWRIDFRSAHAGLHHQLYADGVLVDFTDTPGRRSFVLSAGAAARRLVIAAVDGEHRATNLAALLPIEASESGWSYRAVFVPPPDYTNGSVEAMGDHAGGQIDPTPLMSIPLDDPALPRWGFGEGGFGSEPMGYDAAGSAGFGRGAFSAGPFGLDAWPLTLAVPLAEEGTHQLLLRAVNENGGSAQADPVGVQSNPPPEPPIALSPTAYVNGILVLELVPG